MNAPKLPTLRLTAEGECVIQESISLDLPPSNKFSVSYIPSDGRPKPSIARTPPQQEGEALNSSDGERLTSDADSGDDADASLQQAAPRALPSDPPISLISSIPEKPRTHMSRIHSMPLPSQLQNPHRPGTATFHSSPHVLFTHSSQVREVSVELADSIQMVIQTMLQISPPQVLDPAKEQFSACTLSVPTSSMSAMFTTMKNINYISANMSSFCEQNTTHAHDDSAASDTSVKKAPHNEFDVGELLQCVGDALSGAAAQAGVDLVLYHGDVGLKHAYVSGDESGISFALSHIVRQVLNTAERGDSIELGLLVHPMSVAKIPQDETAGTESPPVDDMLNSSSPLEFDGPVKITICISHKYAPSDIQSPGDHPRDSTNETRAKPTFSTLLLRRILLQINGNLVPDLPPPAVFASGRTCHLEMVLDRVPLPPPGLQDEETNKQPTLEQLSSFGDSLKGKKVTLYASAKGSFAHHLTSYLTTWGMDVTHVSPDGQVDGLPEQSSLRQGDNRPPSFSPLLTTYPEGSTSANASAKPDVKQSVCEPPSFVIIDDDVDLLKERLQVFRSEYQPQPSPMLGRKRPSLSSNHRPRSSPQIARLLNFSIATRCLTQVVLLHFTSLANYKRVKDVMQSITIAYANTATPLPEILIIPKPAGPRRFLTSLHTAITKPTIDPFFIPIATSPMSPGMAQMAGSFFTSPISETGNHPNNVGNFNTGCSQNPSPSLKNANRPHGSRTNSDRSTRSVDGGTSLPSAVPPSPLAFPDNVEYFSSAAQKLGSSPSSGLVIQSPDGQTAGIYFHPKSKNPSRNPSSHSMERDRGQLTVPSPRRGSTPRVPSGGKVDLVAFSSLHDGPKGKAGVEAKNSPSSGPISPAQKTSVGSPKDDQIQPASSPSNIPSPVPRRASDDARKLASSSPGQGTPTPNRRRLSKRQSNETAPLMLQDPKRKISAPSDANVVPPISVLIVDDNPINQTILSTFMKRKRIKYDLASNGREAVQKWRTGGFHLILMDIQMPIMDGIQATKEIRRLEKSNAADGYPSMSEEGSTPSERSASSSSLSTSESRSLNSPYRSSVIIVALTASSLQSDRVAALAAGCNDFLTKPVSLLWLNNKIIEWGSIKALQMWADIRPEAVRSLASGQAAQARSVAERLHVPKRLSPSPTRRSTSAMEDNAAALALASSAGSIPPLPSPTSAIFKATDRSQGTSLETSSAAGPSSNAKMVGTALDTKVSQTPAESPDGLSIPPHLWLSLANDIYSSADDTPQVRTPLANHYTRVDSTGTSSIKSRTMTPVQRRSIEQPAISLPMSLPLPSSPNPDSVDTRENGCLSSADSYTYSDFRLSLPMTIMGNSGDSWASARSPWAFVPPSCCDIWDRVYGLPLLIRSPITFIP
ncbi:unnamed protein product [Cyclocybe aegerita]|uniref:Response regulatory domain-containing protein n=1 Tax=Cyclocybe aegerita TaxID=1973307 RepID=A0A8S0WKG4_CYCAE|nr:unnamed protein product [Cyclocybe aegerita]